MDRELLNLSECFKSAQHAAFGDMVTDKLHDKIVECVGVYTAFVAAHHVNVGNAEPADKVLEYAGKALLAGGNRYKPEIAITKLATFTASYNDAIKAHVRQ